MIFWEFDHSKHTCVTSCLCVSARIQDPDQPTLPLQIYIGENRSIEHHYKLPMNVQKDFEIDSVKNAVEYMQGPDASRRFLGSKITLGRMLFAPALWKFEANGFPLEFGYSDLQHLASAVSQARIILAGHDRAISFMTITRWISTVRIGKIALLLEIIVKILEYAYSYLVDKSDTILNHLTFNRENPRVFSVNHKRRLQDEDGANKRHKGNGKKPMNYEEETSGWDSDLL